MSTTTPPKKRANSEQYKTPKKNATSKIAVHRKADATETESSSDDSEEQLPTVVELESTDEEAEARSSIRKSRRKPSPTKRYQNYKRAEGSASATKTKRRVERAAAATNVTENEEDQQQQCEEALEMELPATAVPKPGALDLQMLQEQEAIPGSSLFGFNTPKKRGGMALVAQNTPKMPSTPKTPKTPRLHAKTPDTKRRHAGIAAPKTPSHVRHRVKSQIAKLVVEANTDDSDFSADGSDFAPSDSSSVSSDCDDSTSDTGAADDDEPKTPRKGRRPIIVPVLPKTPSAARQRQTAARSKHRSSNNAADYVPESDGYFQSHAATGKILTSDHTLDRLRQPRLPADRVFTLLAEMRLCAEHEASINAIVEEYRSYFPKWMYILNEGFNLLLFGLGSKRQLLQSFHRQVLAQQTVLVVNGFFPSLTLKDILDSITGEILDAGVSASNAHEAVDMIEEEFALIPETHLYLIVHNLDGTMLRNAKAQAILGRLSKVPNIHLLASVDHINTPLLWDHNKLSNFNFSWWDCTTMLPYTDETAFENSLLVQNSGELALASMRSVFSSLTTNSRGIYMVIVKYQLKNKGNPSYQGMPFKDLYWSCREAFLVSSDLALRAQLTEFLDHKLVKSKRSVDGSEQLTIPIDGALLQQFLEEHEKK